MAPQDRGISSGCSPEQRVKKVSKPMALSVNRCENESILRVIPTGNNTPAKVILPRMLALKYQSSSDTQDLHFGKSRTKAILLEGVNSRGWGSKGYYRN
jgi:hypothetical protein